MLTGKPLPKGNSNQKSGGANGGNKRKNNENKNYVPARFFALCLIWITILATDFHVMLIGTSPLRRFHPFLPRFHLHLQCYLVLDFLDFRLDGLGAHPVWTTGFVETDVPSPWCGTVCPLADSLVPICAVSKQCALEARVGHVIGLLCTVHAQLAGELPPSVATCVLEIRPPWR